MKKKGVNLGQFGTGGVVLEIVDLCPVRIPGDINNDWVVDIDLEKFFDKISHQRLIARLAVRIEDRRTIKLISKMLKAKVVMFFDADLRSITPEWIRDVGKPLLAGKYAPHPILPSRNLESNGLQNAMQIKVGEASPAGQEKPWGDANQLMKRHEKPAATLVPPGSIPGIRPPSVDSTSVTTAKKRAEPTAPVTMSESDVRASSTSPRQGPRARPDSYSSDAVTRIRR